MQQTELPRLAGLFLEAETHLDFETFQREPYAVELKIKLRVKKKFSLAFFSVASSILYKRKIANQLVFIYSKSEFSNKRLLTLTELEVFKLCLKILMHQNIKHNFILLQTSCVFFNFTF